MIWVWGEGKFEAHESTGHIDRVLIAAKLVDSRAEAQRLIKANGVSWRPAHWDGEPNEWQKVTDFRQTLEPGLPCNVKIGNGLGRLVTRKDGKEGWIWFRGATTVLVPEEDQKIEAESEFWDLGIRNPADRAAAEWMRMVPDPKLWRAMQG